MKIAILGGGFTGLTAAYYLAKKKHQVFLFEKEGKLGGLAAGFSSPGWQWSLERTYHHLFANDKDILDFFKEIEFKNVFFRSPQTSSLYKVNNNYRIIPLESPKDLIVFPLLNLVDRFRAGVIVAFLKISPFFKFFEKTTAEIFLKKTMGEKAWYILWEELFRKKFGKFAGIILTSFIWARIKKRTKNLGYIKGGFQTFVDYLEGRLINQKVNIFKNCEIQEIVKKGEKYLIHKQEFDRIIATIPTPTIAKIGKNILPKNYLNKLSQVRYLHAVNLIIETDNSLFDKTYWMNICTDEIPVMGIVQHTNFINKENYGGRHLLYIANYVEENNKLLKMSKEEIIKLYFPYLKILNSKLLILNSWLFVSLCSQPIFDKKFLENKPDFITPAKNFFIANLDMTYPYDRGTNFAVKTGKKVAELI